MLVGKTPLLLSPPSLGLAASLVFSIFKLLHKREAFYLGFGGAFFCFRRSLFSYTAWAASTLQLCVLLAGNTSVDTAVTASTCLADGPDDREPRAANESGRLLSF